MSKPTISMAVYPVRSLEQESSLDHLKHELSSYRPDVEWELWKYSAIDDLLKDLPDFARGSIVLYRGGTRISSSLLAYQTPLTIIEENSLGCSSSSSSSLASTTHTILPTIADQQQESFYPFFAMNVQSHDVFLAKQDQPLLVSSNRDVVLSYVGPPPSSRLSYKAMDTAVQNYRQSLESMGTIVYPDSNQALSTMTDDEEKLDVLSQSRLTLIPPEEVIKGPMFVTAIEMGSIPVIQIVDEYKGCIDPLKWLVERGAPVVMVDDWSELPTIVEEVLADPEALDQQQAALLKWWDDYKADAVSSLVQHWEDAQEHQQRLLIAALPTLLASTIATSNSSRLRTGIMEASISLFFVFCLVVLGHTCAQARYREQQKRQIGMAKKEDGYTDTTPMLLDLTSTKTPPAMSPPQEISPGQSPRVNKTEGGLLFTTDEIENKEVPPPGKLLHHHHHHVYHK